jgi:hypothetical protein
MQNVHLLEYFVEVYHYQCLAVLVELAVIGSVFWFTEVE